MPKLLKVRKGEEACFFPVAKIRKSYDFNGDRVNSKTFAIINTDTGRELGDVSADYELVPTERMVDQFETALTASGLKGYTRELLALGDNGEKFEARYTFTDKAIKLPSPCEVGDMVGWSMKMGSSYNKSRQIWTVGGGLRAWCANTCTSIEESFKLGQRHIGSKVWNKDGSLNINFGEAIEKATEAISAFGDMASELATLKLTDEQGLAIIYNVSKASGRGLPDNHADGIARAWLNRPSYDSKPNGWTLLNAQTLYTSRCVADKPDVASRIDKLFPQHLVQCGRNKARFGKFTTLPVVEGLTERIATQADKGEIELVLANN